MSKYGIPYMGSKAKIIEQLIRIFPRADNFYDLFGGGFSVTHGMLVHRGSYFKRFHFNEIRSGICTLIQDAINGKYSYKNFLPQWISREEFFDKKELNPYIKIIWSFGNNGKGYLFGVDVEEEKKSLHNAIVFNEFDDFSKKILGTSKFSDGIGIKERRLHLKARLRLIGERIDLQQLEQLERLEQLQQLERLEQLEQLERLSFYSGSYEQVPILESSVIYCDIPYGGTNEYDSNIGFNRKDFFDWAHQNINPVFISEYHVEDSRFRCVWNHPKRSLFSQVKTVGNKTEKVYVNRAGYSALLKGLKLGKTS